MGHVSLCCFTLNTSVYRAGMKSLLACLLTRDLSDQFSKTMKSCLMSRLWQWPWPVLAPLRVCWPALLQRRLPAGAIMYLVETQPRGSTAVYNSTRLLY